MAEGVISRIRKDARFGNPHAGLRMQTKMASATTEQRRKHVTAEKTELVMTFVAEEQATTQMYAAAQERETAIAPAEQTLLVEMQTYARAWEQKTAIAPAEQTALVTICATAI